MNVKTENVEPHNSIERPRMQAHTLVFPATLAKRGRARCIAVHRLTMHEKRPHSLTLCAHVSLWACAAWRDLRTGGYDVHQLAVVECVHAWVEGVSDGENLHIRTRPSTLHPRPKPTHLPAPSTITVLVEGWKAS